MNSARPSRLVVMLISLAVASAALAASDPVEINWLGKTPAPAATGVSWGVPWPKGAVPKAQKFSLATADGRTLPLQTWPLATWPDGSLKWSGFATVAGPDSAGPFKLSATETAAGAASASPSTSHPENRAPPRAANHSPTCRSRKIACIARVYCFRF